MATTMAKAVIAMSAGRVSGGQAIGSAPSVGAMTTLSWVGASARMIVAESATSPNPGTLGYDPKPKNLRMVRGDRGAKENEGKGEWWRKQVRC